MSDLAAKNLFAANHANTTAFARGTISFIYNVFHGLKFQKADLLLEDAMGEKTRKEKVEKAVEAIRLFTEIALKAKKKRNKKDVAIASRRLTDAYALLLENCSNKKTLDEMARMAKLSAEHASKFAPPKDAELAERLLEISDKYAGIVENDKRAKLTEYARLIKTSDLKALEHMGNGEFNAAASIYGDLARRAEEISELFPPGSITRSRLEKRKLDFLENERRCRNIQAIRTI